MIINESYGEEFDEDDVEDEEFDEDEDMSYADPAEQAADYVGDMEPALGRMGRQYLEELMNIADNNPEVIKDAFGYIEQYKQERFKDMKEVMKVTDTDPKLLKEGYGYIEDCKDKHTTNSGGCEGRFLICDADNIKLLTVYFLLKYPDVKPEERMESLEERLKRQGCPKEEAAQEMELMHWYEDLLIRNFRQIYFHQKPPKAVTDQIEEAIRNDRVDDKIRKLARESRTDKYLNVDWKYYLGMSAIHFALSARLKNLVSVCFALKADTMFAVIDEIDMRRRRRFRSIRSGSERCSARRMRKKGSPG